MEVVDIDDEEAEGKGASKVQKVAGIVVSFPFNKLKMFRCFFLARVQSNIKPSYLLHGY